MVAANGPIAPLSEPKERLLTSRIVIESSERPTMAVG